MRQLETHETTVICPRFICMDEVVGVVGLSRATVYRLVDSGEFPRPVKLSPGKRAWLASEIVDWLNKRIEDRDA